MATIRRFHVLLVTLCLAAGSGTILRAAQPTAAELQALGLRNISGRHLTLWTDLPAGAAVDELPGVFDLAVPQWCEYFGIQPARAENWKVTGYLMQDQQRFQRAGLIPADLPDFLNGYQRGDQLWLYDQPSDYYRRVLLLHEGTHGFMSAMLGGCGPPWYMEGMADYLATHDWSEGRLQLGFMPRSNEQSAYWGRIKIIRDAVANNRPLSLVELMRYGPRAHLQVEPYAWCWAAVSFFDRHPEFSDALKACREDAKDTTLEFSRRFYQRLAPRWWQVELDWYHFIGQLDYGMEIERAAIRFSPAPAPLTSAATCEIVADRGWQSSGWQVEAGRTYVLQADGRYEIHQQPRTWYCEPQGVTLRYYRGHPLGALQCAIVTREAQGPAAAAPLLNPTRVGRGIEFTPDRSGWLLLRINDDPSELSENRGSANVTIRIKD